MFTNYLHFLHNQIKGNVYTGPNGERFWAGGIQGVLPAPTAQSINVYDSRWQFSFFFQASQTGRLLCNQPSPRASSITTRSKNIIARSNPSSILRATDLCTSGRTPK